MGIGSRNVLFVCTVNRLRSPTFEFLARKDGLAADSAGTDSLAIVGLRLAHLEWADLVVCMEPHHERRVRDVCVIGGIEIPPIQTLHIPDEFDFMDPKLEKFYRAWRGDGM